MRSCRLNKGTVPGWKSEGWSVVAESTLATVPSNSTRRRNEEVEENVRSINYFFVSLTSGVKTRMDGLFWFFVWF